MRSIVVMIGILVSAGLAVAAPAPDDPPSPPDSPPSPPDSVPSPPIASDPVDEPLPPTTASRRVAERPPEASAAHDRCDSGGYLEPALLLGRTASGGLGVLNRVAAGILFRDCDAQWTATTHARVGATIYISDFEKAGVGLEAEVDRPLSHTWRLGLRVSAESVADDRHLYSFGARAHASDALFFELDGAHATHRAGEASTTVMGGVGFEGKGGSYVGATELVGGGVLFLLLVAALAGSD
jgi:hypothetical protein